jgi:hypothetical protein
MPLRVSPSPVIKKPREAGSGNGLTGEPFFEREVTNLYLRSPFYSAHWQVVTPASPIG